MKNKGRWVINSDLLFWIGNLLFALIVGFATSTTIASEKQMRMCRSADLGRACLKGVF
jgi:hypothetical protein